MWAWEAGTATGNDKPPALIVIVCTWCPDVPRFGKFTICGDIPDASVVTPGELVFMTCMISGLEFSMATMAGLRTLDMVWWPCSTSSTAAMVSHASHTININYSSYRLSLMHNCGLRAHQISMSQHSISASGVGAQCRCNTRQTCRTYKLTSWN